MKTPRVSLGPSSAYLKLDGAGGQKSESNKKGARKVFRSRNFLLFAAVRGKDQIYAKGICFNTPRVRGWRGKIKQEKILKQ